MSMNTPRARSAVLAVAAIVALSILGPARAADAVAPAAPPVPAKPAAPPVDRLSDEQAGKGLDLTAIAHSPADASPYLGPAEAPVVVNVFTDFQCPVCKRAADPIKQLAFDFPDKVKVVVRNNALPMHARSEATALAALAAGQQGKFWQYYDRLWAAPGARDEGSLARIATELELDLERWKKDRADPANVARVHSESAAAVRLGAAGTPGFFVNGMRQVGWGSFRDLHDRVERELAAGSSLATAGTSAKAIAEARIRQTADRNPKREGEGAPNVDDWVKVLLAP